MSTENPKNLVSPNLDSQIKKRAKDFLNENLIDSMFEHLDLLKNPLFAKLKSDLKKVVILEENTLHIPIIDFTDIINLTISVEFDKILEGQKNEPITISKFTELSTSDLGRNDIKFAPDETYSTNQIIQCLNKILENQRIFTEVKNDFYIISFE